MELEFITPEPMQLPMPEVEDLDSKWKKLWQAAQSEAEKASTKKQGTK